MQYMVAYMHSSTSPTCKVIVGYNMAYMRATRPLLLKENYLLKMHMLVTMPGHASCISRPSHPFLTAYHY